MVPGWVLVLLCVHPDDAGNVWVHPCPATDQKYVGDQEDGKQTLHDPGTFLIIIS